MTKTELGQTDGDVVVDALVIGAGAGGLSAAMSAKLAGLDVLIVEKTDSFGGTAARSGGMLWIPMNPLSIADGVVDSREAAKAYIRAEAKDVYDEEIADSYLTHAPRMVEAYRANYPSMKFVRNDGVAR